LSGAERDSVCEQCHLKGEARITNPGKQFSDFQPGQRAEDVFTTYVAARPDGKKIKVVSHVEQLARSVCARQSAGKLWCGTCHNPHEKPAAKVAAAYYRARCLTCHAGTLDHAHAAPGRDCVSCHMPTRPASDGGHTAFTDHRISRDPSKEEPTDQPASIIAWRQPADISLQRRNLALAFATLGKERQLTDYLTRSYEMLTLLEREFPNDPALQTQLGLLALNEHRPEQALDLLEHVANLEPDSAEAQTNWALALIRLNRQPEAVEHLQKALALDPLLRAPVSLLARLYQQEGEAAKTNELLANYRRAMGVTGHLR
jgi:predicted CXXCH cytochrome family protein